LPQFFEKSLCLIASFRKLPGSWRVNVERICRPD
jgi:hypothetical protein